MSAPSTLPLEARLVAWSRLWERLLAEPEDAEPESEPDEHEDEA